MKKRKLAALISLSVANIAALCCVTFAWYGANLKLNNPVDDVSAVAIDDVTVSHKIYAWDDDLRQGVECLNEDGTSYKFGLEQYDSYILERNATLSKIIRFELKREVVMNTGDTTFGVTIPCSGLLFDSNNKMTNNISNIITFRCFLDVTNSSDDADAVYTTAMDYANNNTNGDVVTASFVTLSTVDDVLTASKTYSLVINGLRFDESSNITYFFLEYNYNSDLINYYYEHSDMDAPGPDSLEGDEVQFIGDINRMTFGVTE